MDVAAFLAQHPPFDALRREQLVRIAERVTIEHVPSGAVILQQGGEPARYLYVIRTGSVEVVDDDRVLDVLMVGESFGQLSLSTGLGPTASLRAHEDTICFLIDAELAEQVLATRRGLQFYGSTVRRQILRVEEMLAGERADPRNVAVGSLVRRRVVTCEPRTPVHQAAALMAKERVSSLVIPTGDRWGIVTDRDLRTRVLAERRDPETPVEQVMSFPAGTVTPETTAAEVLAMMFERDVHHFPVVDPRGGLVGVVTDTDLMRLERYSPASLKSAIQRAGSVEEAAAAGRDLPRVVFALVDAGAQPDAIGHVVSVTVDAFTTRLLELVIRDIGSAPLPWAWIALGSAARHEQALNSDQDHALAYATDGRPDQEVDAYFGELAGRVTDGLEAAGIPRCDGGAMAENPAMRKSMDAWVAAFRGWIDDPGLEGSILTSVVFDYRRVTGPLDVEPALDREVRNAARNRVFLRHLGRPALAVTPPTGFFGDLVVDAGGDRAGTLDVKSRGITLITNLAREYAVSASIAEQRTIARLRGAGAAGRIDRETSEGLQEAFLLLWRIRLEHHVDEVRAGRPPDDAVDPKALGPLRRRALKEAFRLIARAQKALASELGMRPP